jgi:3-oxoacyl-[acyl-carrier protein] reductase
MTNPLFDLTGRSALVTGAGGGIGAAVARALAAAGAAVLVSDIDAAAASIVAQDICANSGNADSIALYVRDRQAADDAAARAAGLAEGTLHILVNNAGVTAPAMFADLTDESFRRVLDIHLMGAFIALRPRSDFCRPTGPAASSTSSRRPGSSERLAN